MTDLLILGGGIAGLTAAIYGVRAGLSTTVIEGRFCGGQILNSPQVDNYPGLPGISGFDLSEQLRRQAEALGASMVSDTVTEVSLAGEKKVLTAASHLYEAKAVILATGATHRRLACPGEDRLEGRGVSYCAACDGAFFKGKDVAVIGGGNTALDDALLLSRSCRTVYLIHRRDRYRAHQAAIQAVAAAENIVPITGTVREIQGDDLVEQLLLQTPGCDRLLPVSGVFVAVGLTPNTQLFSELSLQEGYIPANEDCHTALPGVFAAGDVRTKPLRQLITAAADGAVAAMEAATFLQSR